MSVTPSPLRHRPPHHPAMTTTVRVALLLCDTPPPPVVAADGDYVRIFSELLRKSQPAGAAYTLDAYDVRTKMEYPADVDAYDGVLYTGSGPSRLPPRLCCVRAR